MDADKRKRYENIASELVRLAGGRGNILGIAHCATRLRLVLEDNDRASDHGNCNRLYHADKQSG